MRTVLTLSLVLVLPSGLLAADKGSSKGGAKPGGSAKPNHTAQIKELEAQKKHLQAQEKTKLKEIESHVKTHIATLHQQKGQMEAALTQKLELEKAQSVKRIEERYAYIRKHDAPLKVWGQLDAATNTLRGTHEMLKTGNPDYGGLRVAAIKSLGTAIGTLQNRLTIHRWNPAERQTAVGQLVTAEADLQNALAYSANKWGVGTPKGMPEAQVTSNRMLGDALVTIDNTRGLVQYAQWEEGVDRNWRENMKRQAAAEVQKTKDAFNGKIKSVDKEVAHHIEHSVKEIEQKKQVAIAQTKRQHALAIKAIDAQIKRLKSSK
jgi:hypothetical protein